MLLTSAETSQWYIMDMPVEQGLTKLLQTNTKYKGYFTEDRKHLLDVLLANPVISGGQSSVLNLYKKYTVFILENSPPFGSKPWVSKWFIYFHRAFSLKVYADSGLVTLICKRVRSWVLAHWRSVTKRSLAWMVQQNAAEWCWGEFNSHLCITERERTTREIWGEKDWYGKAVLLVLFFFSVFQCDGEHVSVCLCMSV